MRVLITGGTGALGKALVQRLASDPLVERIRVLSRDEHKVAAMASDYVEPHPIRWLVGDVRDYERMRAACHGVDVVIHAAALKRIDSIVNDSIELDKTNIAGTVNVLQAALETKVRKVLVVSSDKAVHPANAYGCSKMMAECHSVGFNAVSMPQGMAVSAVRYGNVFKSTGSIWHIWSKCIAEKKPLPLTDYRMTRFHITLPQAVEFCLSSLMRMQGGEIFIPELRAYAVCDLGAAMLKLAGEVIQFENIGLRPGGEKLHERMLSDEEPSRTLWQRDRYMVMPSYRPWSAAPYSGVALTDDPQLVSNKPSRLMSVEDIIKEVF